MRLLIMIKNYITLLLLLIIFFVGAPGFSLAQFLPGVDSGFLSIYPEFPKPNETFTAEIKSYSFDLSVADIVWSINGKEYRRGKGLTIINVTAGDVGSVTKLHVFAITREGYPINQEAVIIPARVNLLFEADTYTPPFYKGKPMYSYQGRVRVVAIPEMVDINGKRLEINQINFKWKERGQVLSARSGIGRNTYSFTGGIIARSRELELEASSLDGNVVAVNTVLFSPIAPKVLVYEKDPAYGYMFNKAIGDNLLVSKDEMTLSIFPYFFNTDERGGFNMDYKWVVNANVAKRGSEARDIIIKKPSGVSGVSEIVASAANTIEYFQYGEKNISAKFGLNSLFNF
jgi:hypothetical protein